MEYILVFTIMNTKKNFSNNILYKINIYNLKLSIAVTAKVYESICSKKIHTS